MAGNIIDRPVLAALAPKGTRPPPLKGTTFLPFLRRFPRAPSPPIVITGVNAMIEKWGDHPFAFTIHCHTFPRGYVGRQEGLWHR